LSGILGNTQNSAMNYSAKIDQDDILRARNVLLASGRRTPRKEVGAYRVLAQVSPAAYLPRLVKALQHLSYDRSYRDRPEASLALCEEAVAAARNVDPTEPERANLLYEALGTCQRALYELGRRTEGLALRAEMLAIGRAQAATSPSRSIWGLSEWASGLSEEGRYDEAADAATELATAELPGGPAEGGLAWTLLQWIAALRDAGRSDEALAAFKTLVDMEAAQAADGDHGSVACHLFALLEYAQMLGTHGRRQQAVAARHEALVLLRELAARADPRSWSGYHVGFWAVLLLLSAAESERPRPGEPRPPWGVPPMQWSPDVRRDYFDSLGALRDEVDALALRAEEDPEAHLPELVRLHRVFTVRSAVSWEAGARSSAARTDALFDEGVELAFRWSRHCPAEGTPALVRSLLDRSAFRTVIHEFGPALDDFREVLRLLGEECGSDGS
jgi:tetratricopeptide (TPR) repeat protein